MLHRFIWVTSTVSCSCPNSRVHFAKIWFAQTQRSRTLAFFVFMCFNQTSWTNSAGKKFPLSPFEYTIQSLFLTSGCMFSWYKTSGCSDPLYKLTACSGKLECLTSPIFLCSIPALTRTNRNYLFILTHLKNLVKEQLCLWQLDNSFIHLIVISVRTTLVKSRFLFHMTMCALGFCIYWKPKAHIPAFRVQTWSNSKTRQDRTGKKTITDKEKGFHAVLWNTCTW